MKRLACVSRGHRWTIRVENGESYDVCSRCGKHAAASCRSRHEGSRGSTATSATATSRSSEGGGAGTNIGTGGDVT